MEKEKLFESEEDVIVSLEEKKLILYNDEVNTFDFVIQTLMEVCGHDSIQAEQCTYIVHYKGKCVVKTGVYDELKPMSEEMTRRKLTVKLI
ncbi:MAG: ATP-dependent Clp protease adaptor ClpS [Hyphomicrobiales bacterium]